MCNFFIKIPAFVAIGKQVAVRHQSPARGCKFSMQENFHDTTPLILKKDEDDEYRFFVDGTLQLKDKEEVYFFCPGPGNKLVKGKTS